MPQADESPTTRDLIELAAKSAAVVAVALPAIGFLTRAIAFSLCGRLDSADSWRLAAAAPLNDLTVAGIMPVLIGIPIYLNPFISARVPERKPANEAEAHPWSFRYHSWQNNIVYAATIIFVVVVGVFSMPWLPPIAYPSSVAVFVIATQWMRRVKAKRGDLRLAWTWPILAVSLLSGSLFAAVNYSLPAAHYAFAPFANMPPGDYLELGQDGSMVYLLPCTGTPSDAIAVPSSSVLRADFFHVKPPTQWTLIGFFTGQAPDLWLETTCPPG